MRRLLIALAVLGFALPGTAAASTTLTPQVTPTSVAVRVAIANTGRTAMRVPKAALLPQAFSVTRRGAPVAYVGPIAKTRPADLVIPAHGRRTVTVDLSSAFVFTVTGRYTIALGGSRTTAEIAARPAPALPRARATSRMRVGALAVSYVGCTGSQPAQVATAIADALTYVTEVNAFFSNRRAGARYVHWFGAYDATRWATARDHYTAMGSLLAGGAIAANCGGAECNPSTFAYVYPVDTAQHNVYLCGAFWSAGATGTDSKAGTFVHELSHFNDIGSTDDHVYGQSGAASLAVSSPADAVDNADNHEYFAENTAPIADNAPAVTVSTASADFGAKTVGTTATPVTVTVTNTGDAAMTMGAISATAPFTTTDDACSNRILAAGAACTVVIGFAPTAVGDSSAALAIPTDAVIAAVPIALSGSGLAVPVVQPVASASPAPAPAPKVAAQAGRGSLTVTADAATSILLQIKRGSKWVPVRTIAAKPGANVLRLKKGTYRIVTDPTGTPKLGKAVVVR